MDIFMGMAVGVGILAVLVFFIDIIVKRKDQKQFEENAARAAMKKRINMPQEVINDNADNGTNNGD